MGGRGHHSWTHTKHVSPTEARARRQRPVHSRLSVITADSAAVSVGYETVVIRIWMSFHSHSGSHPDNTGIAKSTRWNWPGSFVSRSICATQPQITASTGGWKGLKNTIIIQAENCHRWENKRNGQNKKKKKKTHFFWHTMVLLIGRNWVHILRSSF